MASNEDIILRALGWTEGEYGWWHYTNGSGQVGRPPVTADDAFRALQKTFGAGFLAVRVYPGKNRVEAAVDAWHRPAFHAAGSTATEALIAAAAKAIEAESKDASQTNPEG